MQEETDIFYTQIIDVFEQEGYSARSLITKQDLKNILDHRSIKTQNHQFSNDIFQQLWLQSQANSRGETLIHIFSQVICQAKKILKERIDKLEGQKGLIQQYQHKIQNKNQQLKQIQQYYDNQDTKINGVRQEIIQLKTKLNEYQHTYKNFLKEHKIIINTFTPKQVYTRHQSIIIPSKVTNIDSYEPTLLAIFHITNVCFILQLIVQTYRIHFFSIVIFLQIYFLLFIGYYQKTAVSYLLIQIVISVIFDLAYIIMTVFTKVYISPQKHSKQIYYFVVVCILLIAQLILKLILAKLLYPFRDKQKRQNKNQFFYFWQTKIYLNENVKRPIRM